MTFKKGKSGNPAGKPKGTLSKITKLKNELLEIGTDRIEEIRKMPIKDLVRALCAIMPKDINVDVNSKSLIVNINKTIAPKPKQVIDIDAEDKLT